jgi:hypothetical protein
LDHLQIALVIRALKFNEGSWGKFLFPTLRTEKSFIFDKLLEESFVKFCVECDLKWKDVKGGEPARRPRNSLIGIIRVS